MQSQNQQHSPKFTDPLQTTILSQSKVGKKQKQKQKLPSRFFPEVFKKKQKKKKNLRKGHRRIPGYDSVTVDLRGGYRGRGEF